MIEPLNFKDEESDPHSKAKQLTKENQNLSRLLREQMFFQQQDNDYMVDKLQKMIEREIESAKNKKI